MKLRSYQQAAVNSIYAWFAQNKEGNPLCVLPCGAGKSLVIAELIRSALEIDNTQRFVVSCHVKELILQNYSKLRAIYPTAPMGIYSAGVGQKVPHKQVVFGGIQSMHKKAAAIGHRDLIIVDEAHTIGSEGIYKNFIKDMQKINPNIRVVGLSATPFRMKGGHLIHGGVFTDVCYDLPITTLIDRGYLSPLIGKSSPVQADMKGVKLTAGEFNQKQAQERFNQHELIAKALDDVFARAHNRKAFLFFCAGVEHAENVHKHLQRRGKKGAVVTGETAKDERERHIAALRTGQYDYLCNNAVLTTGTDIPRIDCVVLFRATKSRGLYMQMLGRGMRLFDGKADCLVLDYGGNMERFGPIDQQPDMSKPRIGNGDAPFKICEKDDCRAPNHATAKCCEVCGHAFFFEEKPVHEATASNGVLFSHELETKQEWRDVGEVLYNKHISQKSGIPTVKVTYCDTMGRPIANEFICFWHSGKPFSKALSWLYQRVSVPRDFMISEQEPEALVDICRRLAKEPHRIQTKKNGKYQEVIDYDFAQPETLHDRGAERGDAHHGSAAI